MYPTNSNHIMCIIDGTNIYQYDGVSKKAIGVIADEFEALQKITDNYYTKLVELGAIVPPKTQEEINADLQQQLQKSQEINQQILEQLATLASKIGGTDNDKSKHSERSQQPVTASSEGQTTERTSTGERINKHTKSN